MAEEIKKQEKPQTEPKQGGKFQAGKEKAPQFQAPKRQKHIVRVAETDLDGVKPVSTGIMEIRGVSHMFANAVAKVTPLADKKILDLSEDEIKQIEDIIYNPQKYNIPHWLFNRRFDPDTGLHKHFAVSNLQLTHTTDINKLKKMKCYKGIRHGLGLPVRGQRTRSSFRKKGATVGVKRAKEQPAKAAPAGGGKK